MIKIQIVFILVIISIFYLFFFKKSLIGVSFLQSNYIGVGFFLETFFFIFSGVALITIFGPEHFWALFKITSNNSDFATVVLLWQFLIFFIALLLFVNTFFKKYLVKVELVLDVDKGNTIDDFSRILFLCLLVFNVFVTLFFGYKHALISAVMSGDSLSLLRYDNVDGGMPTFFIYFFFINSYILASLAGFKKGVNSLLYLMLAIYFCSISGQKMPVVNVILIFTFTRLMASHARLNIAFLLKIILIPLVLIVVLYFFVKLQYQHYNIELFLDYFLNRAGVGFVAGYYEQFVLRLSDLNYIWHSVPFSNQLNDSPNINFHKDLMMISENRIDPNNIGIKNTLFFAEAYAIGGWFLFVLSPIIYAFNYLLSMTLLLKVFEVFVFKSRDVAQVTVGLVFVFFINLTGGFSDLLFFKSPILILIFISLPVLLFCFIKKLRISI